MRRWLSNLKERIEYFSILIGRRIQSAVVFVALLFVYLIGIGLTRLVASIFFRRYLRLYKRPENVESYWLDAKGYEPDLNALRKQV